MLQKHWGKENNLQNSQPSLLPHQNKILPNVSIW